MKPKAPAPTRPPRTGQHGFGLFEAMIALVILSFGLLGMTRLQARMVAGTTEAQQRLAAQQLVDELLARALIDTANSACYTLPASGSCGSTAARTGTNTWGTDVGAALPDGAATSTLNVNGRLVVAVTWTGRESGATRTLEVTTDVRN